MAESPSELHPRDGSRPCDGSFDGRPTRERRRRNSQSLRCFVLIACAGCGAWCAVLNAFAQSAPAPTSPPASTSPTTPAAPAATTPASPAKTTGGAPSVGQAAIVEVWPGGPKREVPGPDPWEYQPYKVQVWLALEPAPEVPEALRVDLERVLRERTDVVFGATWDLSVSPPPSVFASELLYRLDRFPPDALVARAKLGKLAAPPKKPTTGASSTSPTSAGPPAGGPGTPGASASGQAPTGSAAPEKAPEQSPAGQSAAGGESAATGPTSTGPAADGQASVVAGPGAAGASGAAAANPGATANPVATAQGGGATTPAEDPPADPLVDELRRVFRGDKLIVATVRAAADRWLVAACEFDLKARRWGPLVQIDCFDLALLSQHVADAVHESFYPIALVNYGREKKVQMKIRAGRLALRDDSPVLLNENALLQPYLRSNDRYGEPKAQGGLQKMPWTYVTVKSRDTSRIECEIHTGIRTSLVGRNTLRTERFALGVRPAGGATHLQLRTNEKPAQPLSGYDVYAKDSNSETTELLGRTDWRGTMDVPYKSEVPLRLVYVKNGNSLLARLPLVPGVEPSMVVDLIPDDRRLQAEGFVSGMQNVITDLVARRELLTKRIRKKLEEQKFGEADELLNELKSLESRDDVQKILDLQQPRMTATQPRVQQKIDKLFEDTRKLLYKFVDPNLTAKVQSEVEQARTGGGGGPIDVLNSPAPPPPTTGGGTATPPAGSPPAGSPPAGVPPASGPPAGAPPAGVAPPAAPPGAGATPPGAGAVPPAGGPPRPAGSNVGT